MKTKMNEEEYNHLKKVWVITGSIALCTLAFVVIPKVMPRISGYLNKKCTKFTNLRNNENDWGPVLVRREMVKYGNEESDICS